MTSIGTMIKRISGLHGTRDLTAWENSFVGKIVEQTRNGDQTASLFPNQVEKIEEIHDKHFAG